jgi:DNA-binding phage protein
LTPKQALAQVRNRRQRAERAKQAHEEAISGLYTAVRAAVEAGVPVAEVAREAGLSRQGVYNVLAGKHGGRR